MPNAHRPFRRPLAATIALLLAAAPALAQTLSPAPAPGLWETRWKATVQGQDLGAVMQKVMKAQLASMPAAQRAEAERMMAAQMGPMLGAPVQECITAAEVGRMTDPKRLLADMQRDNPDCRYEPVKVSGGTLGFKGRCTDEEGFSGPVQGELTMASDKSWTGRWGGRGRMDGFIEMAGVKPAADGSVDFQMTGGGRWLAASCGAVKPR